MGKTLDGKSFLLGFHMQELPLEPELLDREAYNLGLQIYNARRNVNTLCSIGMGAIGLISLQKSFGDKNSAVKESLPETILSVDEAYQKFQGLIDSVPQFKEHTGKVERRTTDTYQSFKESAKDALS